MKKLRPTKLSLVIAVAFAAPALWAQQTPTDIGRITVEGLGGASTGLMTAEESPQARSSVNRNVAWRQHFQLRRNWNVRRRPSGARL